MRPPGGPGAAVSANPYVRQLARASHLVNVGRDAQAMTILTGLLRDFPAREGNTWLVVFSAHHTANRMEAGLEAALRAVACLPETVLAHYAVGAALCSLDRYAEARPALRTALALDPDDARAYVSLSTALGRLDRSQEALDTAIRAVQVDPENASVHLAVGMELWQSDPETSKRALSEAIRLDPTNASAALLLSLHQARQGDQRDAARGAANQAALDPHAPAVHAVIDLLLVRVRFCALRVTTIGMYPLLLAALVVRLAQEPVVVLALPVLVVAVLTCVQAYQLGRPLADTLPGRGKPLAVSLLRRRPPIAVVALLTGCLWVALTVSSALLPADHSAVLVRTALAGVVLGYVAAAIGRREIH